MLDQELKNYIFKAIQEPINDIKRRKKFEREASLLHQSSFIESDDDGFSLTKSPQATTFQEACFK
jgi:hypothetical protein